MAKKKNNPPPRRPAGSRGGLHSLALVFSVVAIGLLVTAPSALIILFVGMAPTAVAIFIDRDPQKFASISVAAMNFAGLSPTLVDFVLGAASFSRALELVSNVFVLVVIYGAAAVGWVLVLALPPAAAIVLGVITDSRIQALRKEQRRLIEVWGEDVAGPKARLEG